MMFNRCTEPTRKQFITQSLSDVFSFYYSTKHRMKTPSLSTRQHLQEHHIITSIMLTNTHLLFLKGILLLSHAVLTTSQILIHVISGVKFTPIDTLIPYHSVTPQIYLEISISYEYLKNFTKISNQL